ncbi:rifin PIR protein, putative [Plasmodium reichenowi]|uniref:Rifin PIR protein, putative n=1 Tax=Plasmodium reichenowi TaxID=5854 RepID=A0A2P9DS82_PLARE|nr:rifin PIR protein, putative [Plasmodium reichenowi]
MKVHHINILLFALSLNILANNKNKPQTTPYIPKIPTNRSLCECELYAPVNYDNDPQMKKVMQQFEDRTSQRLLEYGERMQSKRKHCKEQCDKEIQKIILKDKLEKQMAEQFATLRTDIPSDDIPTCVCEKSMVDKVEKGCLRCGYGLGTVAPTVGLIGSVAIGAWKNVALDVATKAAIAAGKAAGEAAGLKAGKDIVILGLEHFKVHVFFPGIFNSIRNIKYYTEVTKFSSHIVTKHLQNCALGNNDVNSTCNLFEFILETKDEVTLDPIGEPASDYIPKLIEGFVKDAKEPAAKAADIATKQATEAAIETNTGVVETASYNLYSAVGYSILVILIIVLIMVIIYLILRYRRKKKMKKKLQYIKLLEE